MLKKYSGNPILRSDNIKLSWANLKVYNCGIVFDKGIYHLLFRAIGRDDFISRIGYGKSRDGIHFAIDPQPVLSPIENFETHGCEDPRITKIHDTYYMTYTAFNGRIGRAAMTSSIDLKTWGQRRLLFPDWHGGRMNTKNGRHLIATDFDISSWDHEKDASWSKAAAIFPEKINDQYYLFFGDDYLWSAVSDDLLTWQINHHPVLMPRTGYFDQSYLEMGPPPFKTDKGWLIFYHGVTGWGNQRIYCVGAVLCDLVDPTRILWRSPSPLIEPKETYELLGLIDVMDGGWDRLKSISNEEIIKLAEEKKLPQAVFCTGAIETKHLQHSVYHLYYSGADTVLCLASGKLKDIIQK